MVGQRQVQDGQYVSAGTQVISIVPLPHVWVIANYKETQMTHVRIGQPAHVTVDAFPGVVLHGHVDSWSPASGAQFSLLPRYRDRQLHQGGTADSSKARARSRSGGG
jgi:membrane fusion protein (multidrug efflux system)